MLIILSPTGGPSGRRPPQGPWPTLLLQDTYCPPNSCIPNRAKTTMKRKSRKRRLMMDFMELRRDTTRFLREFQYLSDRRMEEAGPPQSCFPLIQALHIQTEPQSTHEAFISPGIKTHDPGISTADTCLKCWAPWLSQTAPILNRRYHRLSGGQAQTQDFPLPNTLA